MRHVEIAHFLLHATWCVTDNVEAQETPGLSFWNKRPVCRALTFMNTFPTSLLTVLTPEALNLLLSLTKQ